MKYIVCTIALIYCLFSSGNGQTSEDNKIKKNGLYVELYPLNSAEGLGLVSINYESIFYRKKMRSLRLSFYPDFSEDNVFVPVTFTRITNPLDKHHFEFGFGASVVLSRYENSWYTEPPFFLFPVMYRYQKSQGFFFRGGINIILSFGGVIPHPSLSLGLKF